MGGLHGEKFLSAWGGAGASPFCAFWERWRPDWRPAGILPLPHFLHKTEMRPRGGVCAVGVLVCLFAVDSGAISAAVWRHSMLRLASILAVTAALQLAGGHWALFQGVAWTKMFAGYLGSYSVVESLSRTFNPELPCSMCLSITEGKKQEQQQAPASAPGWAKLDYFLAANRKGLPLPHVKDARFLREAAVAFLNWVDDVPQPVPRFLA